MTINVANLLFPILQDSRVVVGVGAGKGSDASTEFEGLLFHMSILWLTNKLVRQQRLDDLAEGGHELI